MTTLRSMTIITMLTVGLTLVAQTITYNSFPASETIQSSQWHQITGCHCGIDKTLPEPFRKTITVNPSQVQTRVNQPVQIRYDASTICNGQGVLDVNGVDISKPNFGGVGTIQFEAGAIKTLPDAYGIVTFSGYTQAKNDTIHINIALQCYDTGGDAAHHCITSCGASIDIPVVVTP